VTTVRTARVRQAVAAALLAGCGAATAPRAVVGGDLRVTVARDGLRLHNVADAPVFVAVYGRAESALILWGPCVDPAVCPPIAPGASRAAPRPGTAARPESEADVYWWRAVRGPDGALRPDSVRTVTVALP
jgi:hypothetical protein